MRLVSVENYLRKGKMEDKEEDFEDKIFEDKEDLEKKNCGMSKSVPMPADQDLARAKFLNSYGISKAVHMEGMVTTLCGCCGCACPTSTSGKEALCNMCKKSFNDTSWHKGHLE